MKLSELAPTLEVGVSSTFDQSLIGGRPTYIGDVHAALVVLIQLGINRLAGIPVAHILSPTALTLIQSASISRFARLGSGAPHPMENGTYVGQLEDVPVFIDPYLDDSVPVRTIVLTKDSDLVVSEVHLKNISFI